VWKNRKRLKVHGKAVVSAPGETTFPPAPPYGAYKDIGPKKFIFEAGDVD